MWFFWQFRSVGFQGFAIRTWITGVQVLLRVSSRLMNSVYEAGVINVAVINIVYSCFHTRFRTGQL